MPKKCWMLQNFDRIHVYPLLGIYGLVLIVFLLWSYFFWRFCPGLLLKAQPTERGKLLFFPDGTRRNKEFRISSTRTVCYLPGNHFKHIQFFTFAHTKGKLFLRIGLASYRLSAAFAFMGRSYKGGRTCVSKDYQIHGHVSNPARQAWYAIYWEISWTDLVFVNRLWINKSPLVRYHAMVELW